MDYEKLKEVIAKQIKENGRGEITGPVLQAVLMAMVDSLCEVYPQTYTDEQKAQARANIDALSNYDGAVTTDKLADTAVTEDKLNDILTAKVNNNVKVVEQALTDAAIDIATKNLKFRDAKGNFFADKKIYNNVANFLHNSKIIENNYFGGNSFPNNIGNNFSGNILGNSSSLCYFYDNVTDNTIGNFSPLCKIGKNCAGNTIGNKCSFTVLGEGCIANTIGDGASGNELSKYTYFSKIDNGVCYIMLYNATASEKNPLCNIHILSGVRGESFNSKLLINIPDEYLNSSRELIITTKRTDGGPSTPEDLVMYYADEVVDKQNKQDTTLETTSKEVVGAINELFNGGVKDKSIDVSKLVQSVQDTLGKVEARVKIINEDTDLNTITENGLYLLCSNHSYTNYPISDGSSSGIMYPNAASLLIVSYGHTETTLTQLLVSVSNSFYFPMIRNRSNYGNGWAAWNNDRMYPLYNNVQNSVKQQDLSALSDTEINNIWDNN